MKKILILYTGGTIGMVKNPTTESLEPVDFQDLQKKLPELALLQMDIDVESFSPALDSSDVGPKEWKRLAHSIARRYDEFHGFLILHGTDTMSYTASALSMMLKNLRKPVIITGSQLPLGDLRSDARENLLTGLTFAALYDENSPVIQEVAIYFEYKLFRGNRSTKFSAEDFDAYQSPNYPILAESGVRLKVFYENLLRHENTQAFTIDDYLCNPEELHFIRLLPGIDLGHLSYLPNIKILFLQVFGSGTLPQRQDIIKPIQEFVSKGGKIIILSQCMQGGVEFGKYENSRIFPLLKAISGRDMTPESAWIKAMHLWKHPALSSHDFQAYFEKSLAGE